MSITPSLQQLDQFSSAVFSSESYITNRIGVEKRDELWKAIAYDK